MKNPRSPLLIVGAALLAAGVASYALNWFGAAAPWLVLAGGLITALFFVLGRLAKAPESRKAESMLYEEGNTTLMDELRKERDE